MDQEVHPSLENNKEVQPMGASEQDALSSGGEVFVEKELTVQEPQSAPTTASREDTGAPRDGVGCFREPAEAQEALGSGDEAVATALLEKKELTVQEPSSTSTSSTASTEETGAPRDGVGCFREPAEAQEALASGGEVVVTALPDEKELTVQEPPSTPTVASTKITVAKRRGVRCFVDATRAINGGTPKGVNGDQSSMGRSDSLESTSVPSPDSPTSPAAAQRTNNSETGANVASTSGPTLGDRLVPPLQGVPPVQGEPTVQGVPPVQGVPLQLALCHLMSDIMINSASPCGMAESRNGVSNRGVLNSPKGPAPAAPCGIAESRNGASRRGVSSSPRGAAPRFPSRRKNLLTGALECTDGSLLLQHVRNNRSPNLQLYDLLNHVVEFSLDQDGSVFIQQSLERATPADMDVVFPEVLASAFLLMTDQYGSYVVQKFFECGITKHKEQLLTVIKGHVLTLALHAFGCRVIEKALDCINREQKKIIVRELGGNVLKCVEHRNGCRVLKKCLECVPPALLEPILKDCQGQVLRLARHRQGYAVMELVLWHCSTRKEIAPLLEKLHQHTKQLAQHVYGSFVIQALIDCGPEETSKVIQCVRGSVVALAQQQYASFVLRKCVSHGTREERAMLTHELFGDYDDSDQSTLLMLMQHRHASLVVQQVLDESEPSLRHLLMLKIRPHIGALHNCTFGKRMLGNLRKHLKNKRLSMAADDAMAADYISNSNLEEQQQQYPESDGLLQTSALSPYAAPFEPCPPAQYPTDRVIPPLFPTDQVIPPLYPTGHPQHISTRKPPLLPTPGDPLSSLSLDPVTLLCERLQMMDDMRQQLYELELRNLREVQRIRDLEWELEKKRLREEKQDIEKEQDYKRERGKDGERDNERERDNKRERDHERVRDYDWERDHERERDHEGENERARAEDRDCVERHRGRNRIKDDIGNRFLGRLEPEEERWGGAAANNKPFKTKKVSRTRSCGPPESNGKKKQ